MTSMSLEKAIDIVDKDLIGNRGEPIDLDVVLNALLVVMRAALNWKYFREEIEDDIPEFPDVECSYTQSELLNKIRRYIAASETGSLEIFGIPDEMLAKASQDIEISKQAKKKLTVKCPNCGLSHAWKRKEINAYKSGKQLEIKCLLCGTIYTVNIIEKK